MEVKASARVKARVKATGEIVEVIAIDGDWLLCSDGVHYGTESLEGIESDIDYWTRLEHQAAIAAMQGIVSSYEAMREISRKRDIPQYVANTAFGLAHALVEKMKNTNE